MQQNKLKKYRPFPAFNLPDRTWPDKTLTRAPIWCSVDLRDGNQALATPMGIEEKLEMFRLLVSVGFKEIEIGFPSASDTEYRFCRELIEKNLIPDDVTVQVLVQARDHLIKKTFEAIDGAHSAIVHLYNSTSPLQRKVTFNMSKDEIKSIAVHGTELVRSMTDQSGNSGIRFQYSPESFSDTETDYALEVCEAVMDAWQPTAEKPIILNLPATVEWTTPNVHADQIEWFCRNISRRDQAIISLHTHNDRGTGVAATELGIMAGADRVEGTLFGNGERTGNLDIVIVALNLFSHGIDPGLQLEDIAGVREVYERCTRMSVHDRHPYAGDLVFTAFSGSHQDAIKKGMDRRVANAAKTGEIQPWEVPYLTIDPEDIGRTYEAIIRINSQSGKGGVAYVLSRQFGLDLPKTMHPEVGMVISTEADKLSKELSAEEIYAEFRREFADRSSPLELVDHPLYHPSKGSDNNRSVACIAKVKWEGTEMEIEGVGNGPISAFVQALEREGWKNFKLLDYRSHAIGIGSSTDSAAYIALEDEQSREVHWGVGIDPSIEMAGLRALVAAFNRLRDSK